MSVTITRTVTETHDVDLPEWVILAMQGHKIRAVKALKDYVESQRTVPADPHSDYCRISLASLARIVETLMPKV